MAKRAKFKSVAEARVEEALFWRDKLGAEWVMQKGTNSEKHITQLQRDLADELEFEAGEIPESCWTGKKRLDKADDL